MWINADYCRDDLFLLKKAGRLLENVLFCQKEKMDMTERLHRYVEKTLGHNILSATLMGLWSIKINKDSGQAFMLAGDNMHLLIEADKDASPAQCYRNWFENIHPDYIHYIHNVMDTDYYHRSNCGGFLSMEAFGERLGKCTMCGS